MDAPLFGDLATVKRKIDERAFQRFFTAVPDVIKVGAEGYIHGWICVRPPCGKAGDKVTHASHGNGTITNVDDKGMHAEFEDGHKAVLGREKSLVKPDEPVAHGIPDVKLDDVLPADKAAQLRSLVKTTSASKSVELDKMRNEAQRSIMKQKFGLSDLAIDGIAGDASKNFTQMSDTETKFQPLTWAAASWSRYGMKSWFAKSYSRGMAMDKPPEVRDSDFEYSDKESPWGDSVTRTFSDQSDEAQKRREDAMAYFGIRTQQMYTQMMLREAKIKQSPSVRYVYGDYADKIAEADKAKKPWDAATNDLSSWMQPQAAAENRVKDFISGQRFVTRKASSVVRLSSDIPQSNMIMHWRLEGHLKSDGLREVVSSNPGGSSINSGNTTVETIEAA